MSKRFRLFLLVVIVSLGVLSLYPTIEWYWITKPDLKRLSTSTRTEIRNNAIEMAKKDSNKILQILRGNVADEFVNNILSSDGLMEIARVAKERLKEKKITISQDAPATELFGVFTGEDEVYSILLSFYRNKIITLKERKNKIINLGLDLSGGTSAMLQVDQVDLTKRLGHAPSAKELSDAVNRAMIVLQSRIDRFGVSEPVIRKSNSDSILIEIPGDNDRERINSFLQGRGTMAFQIVDADATQKITDLQKQDPTWTFDGENTPDFVNAGSKVMEYVTRDAFGLDLHQRWIVVYEDIDNYGVNGEYLQQAQVTSDPLTNQPVVNFQLNSEGAQKLAKLTSDYLNDSMAIVMDGKVRAYATLTTVISNGRAIISGFSREMAQDIATILQTAALPVQLEVVDQQVIGPTLGQATVNVGIKAVSIGFLLVVVFMIFYYKRAGIISVLALFFNLFFLVSILSALNFTITLTGIAGIILTVGMAVDANVLIFERIKEELFAGKTRRTAIENGFKKAFWTILDANITTFIAAFFISQLASGTIQGFAVTLSTGIVTTLFSALVVSRLLFDFGTETLKLKKISISWRRS